MTNKDLQKLFTLNDVERLIRLAVKNKAEEDAALCRVIGATGGTPMHCAEVINPRSKE